MLPGVVGLAILLLWAACWGFNRQSSIEAATRQDQERARLIGGSIVAPLRDKELTVVRRIVMDAAAELGLSRCRIVLPSGDVIADSTPSLITLAVPPEQWDAMGQRFAAPIGTEMTVVPIEIPDRGWVQIELIRADTGGQGLSAAMHAAFGTTLAVVSPLSWFTLRRFKRRWRGAEEVRRALIELDRGETELSILQISESLGTEVRTWNALLRGRSEVPAAIRPPTEERTDAGDGQLYAACDALPSGLLVIDGNETIRYSNGAARMMLRVGQDQVAGGQLPQIVHDPQVLTAVREALAGGRRRNTVDFERSEDGNTSWFRVNIRPLRRNDGGGAVLTIHDVTQARSADAARDTFIAQATHELRTPLTNIRLYTESAIEAGDDALARSTALNVINTECRRLERIVGDMLSVSEIEAGSFQIALGDVRLDDREL
ncbi:MAG TPA: PAS domain-containing protein, partial [Tepidisphaeraceae bacterium]|nr:PAS domain-containing protein [Tepidisphaeraceae bacterium]